MSKTSGKSEPSAATIGHRGGCLGAHPTLADRCLRVLLVEDNQHDHELVLREIRTGGYEVIWQRVDTRATMQAALGTQNWDVVISDYVMPRFSAPGALALLQARGLDVPFIIVSGGIVEELAVAAMRAGAHDYLSKTSLARLVPAIEREVREAAARRDRRQLEAAEREAAQIAAALARVGRELIGSLRSPDLLSRLCQLTTAVLACDYSYTILWQRDEDMLVAMAGYGDPADEWEAVRTLKVPRATVAELIARLEHEDMVQLVEMDLMLPPLAMKPGNTVSLVVALRTSGELFGLQVAGYRGQRRRFSPQQERIAVSIAEQTSIALDHARVVDQLERANRLKSDFVSTMSHELRTPLNVILGYTGLMLEEEFGALTPDQSDILSRVDKSARELAELITATLDLGRLEAGRLPLDIRATSLSDLVTQLDAETRELQTKPDVELAWQVPARFPELYTDPGKLKVVLKNLVSNALKFTQHGRVTVAARGGADGVDIAVTDTGIGMTPDALPIIFEPFRQIESATTRHYGGVGLGLYVVRRLLDVLGGSIAVESEVGRGSTFHVHLPTSHAAVPAPPRDNLAAL